MNITVDVCFQVDEKFYSWPFSFFHVQLSQQTFLFLWTITPALQFMLICSIFLQAWESVISSLSSAYVSWLFFAYGHVMNFVVMFIWRNSSVGPNRYCRQGYRKDSYWWTTHEEPSQTPHGYYCAICSFSSGGKIIQNEKKTQRILWPVPTAYGLGTSKKSTLIHSWASRILYFALRRSKKRFNELSSDWMGFISKWARAS